MLGAAISSQLITCDRTPSGIGFKHMDIKLPPFSKINLHKNLDRLLNAFESKGMKVSQSLLPSIPESELRERCSWFPGQLTEEIIALYEWRGGQEEVREPDSPFWFRDNSFCSVERAEFEYKSMMDSYGSYSPDHDMLKHAFPIASFDGACYVIPTKEHNLKSVLKRPVISVYEDIDIYYYSMEKMMETCVEWVEHNQYTSKGLYPRNIELAIWRKHNPGIFS